MDFLHKFLLLVIIVIISSWLVIILFFIFINKCLSRAGKQRIIQFPRKSSDFTVKINQYQERNFESKTPPLPSRSQFLTAEAQSYENLAEEQNFSDYEQDKQCDYVKLEDEGETLPLPPEYQHPDPAADNASTEDYDDIGGEDENEGEEDYDDVG
ncbi:hypothetical protein VZT92_006691 [Zoarces viviparus]|uniref:Uncharacterized protein n=1 Tax=Zoarces viviparus TaxID=48416 RepID=A0AAW1FTF6_ZOAVI